MATQILGKVAYTSRGAYDSSFSYEINDVVTYKGSSYVSKKETKGNLPTNEEYWMLLAEKGATYQVTKEDLNNIANEITADANSAFNQNVTKKTNAFDANATSQTSAFNENAGEKITAFDNNANEKTTSYNNNATSALSAYNTNHNEKVEAYNTNANTKLEEFNANANSYDERITDNTNRVKRVENTLYDSGEASGTSINIKDSTLAEFQKITIDGVCEQVTTNGYNLLQNINYYNWNNNTGATQEKIDDYIKVIMPEDVSIYSGIYAANMLTQITNLVGQKLVYSFYAKADANRELLVQVPLLNTHNRVNLTTQWQRFSFIYEGAANQSPTFYCGEDLSTSTYYIKDIMLEVGTELHDYEPYTGLQPSPSLSYPQPIEVIDEGFEVVSCAKNRLIFEPYSFSSQGIKTEFDGNKFKIKGTASSNWAFLSPTILSNLEIGTYTLSKYKETPFQIMLILENEEKRVMTKYLGKPATEVDFSLNEKATKITLGIDNITADDEIDVEIEVQVEKGSTSTEYEAPISSRVPINLPDGKFIGKLPNGPEDQVRIAFNEEKGEYKPKLSKKLGKVVFNGREDWDLAERTESNNGVFYLENFLTTYGAVRGDCLSNYATYTNGFSAEVGQFDIHYGQIRFYAPSNSMTKEEWKEKLSTNNIEVYYPLAEPYEVDLGVIDMPLSYSPETNIFTTHELEPNINAKYYRNFINTIQNLQVNEKALQQELIDINSRLSALETNLVNMASVEEVESEVVE